MLPSLIARSSISDNCIVHCEEGLHCGLHRVYYHMRAGWAMTQVGAPNHKMPVGGECSVALNHRWPLSAWGNVNGGLGGCSVQQPPPNPANCHPSSLIWLLGGYNSTHSVATTHRDLKVKRRTVPRGAWKDKWWQVALFFSSPFFIPSSRISLVFGWAQINKLFKWKERGRSR